MLWNRVEGKKWKYYMSHTMQALLEGCDVDHLCGFLQSCAKDFPHIAMDRSGSHVAETALKSLAMHLQDDETYSLIENTLTTICQVLSTWWLVNVNEGWSLALCTVLYKQVLLDTHDCLCIINYQIVLMRHKGYSVNLIFVIFY